MRELLGFHTVLKVQINQNDDSQVAETCQELEDQCNAHLLQLKGKTALLMQADADLDSLKQSSSHQRPSQNNRSTRLQLDSIWRNGDDPQAPLQLSESVQSHLSFLTSTGVLSADELDKRSLRYAPCQSSQDQLILANLR